MGSAQSFMVFDEILAKKISMHMMGADSVPDTLDEAYLSTLTELTNTLLSSISNNLSSRLGDDITPNPPEVKVYHGAADFPAMRSGRAAKFTYQISVDSDINGELIHYIDEPSASRWNATAGQGAAPRGAATQAPPQNQGMDLGGGGDSGGLNLGEMNIMGETQSMGGDFSMSSQGGGQSGNVSINPVNFPSLSGGGQQAGQMPANIDLLMDVQMVMTVELGRTKKYVKDILGLGEGSIIELDKLAGEPVDLLVNGKLIAKGEVVVIDENFGVRVTDIVGPAERLARLTSD